MTTEIKKPVLEFSITLPVKVTAQNIDDILCSALEGGINYWCRRAVVDDMHGAKYASEAVSRGAKMTLIPHEDFGKDDPRIEIDVQSILKGIQMHMEQCKRDILDDHDAGDADAIVQYAAFGKVIYG